MGNEKFACPRCKTSMDQVRDPDMTYEKCGTCGGIFLDKGELNALATGMAGDIEFCSVEAAQEFTDKYPSGCCPKCPGQIMNKEDLLICSDLLFDYCKKCGGWFLDPGEIERMNEFLGGLRKSQGGAQDTRYQYRGHLVTNREILDVCAVNFGPARAGGYVPIQWRRLDVYYKRPLNAGLRVTSETWGAKLLKLFGAQDVATGDAEFDRTFLVKAEDRGVAVKVLSEPVRRALLRFATSPLAKLGYKRNYAILDNRITYSYSDWGRSDTTPSKEEEQMLTDALVDVAETFESPA